MWLNFFIVFMLCELTKLNDNVYACWYTQVVIVVIIEVDFCVLH